MNSLLVNAASKTRESSKRKHKDELDRQINEVAVLEKKHRKAMKGKEEREDDIPSPSGDIEEETMEGGKNTSKTVARRTFFGVIDNVSSFSGMIEGPYEFGFAISITVDRQTLKGIVFKKDDGKPSVSDDDMDLHNLSAVRASRDSRPSSSPPTASPPPTPVVSNNNNISSTSSIPTSHSSTSTPASTYTKSSAKVVEIPKIEEDEDHRLPDIRNITNFPPSREYPEYPEVRSNGFSFNPNPLPNIQSMFQKIAPETSKFMPPSATPPGGNAQVPHRVASSPQSPSSPPSASPPTSPTAAPLPPQPQLQRQKQRQKNRQEKRFLELAQHNPEKLKDLIHRENSKVPLLGDEKLINKGMDIMQQIKTLNTNYVR